VFGVRAFPAPPPPPVVFGVLALFSCVFSPRSQRKWAALPQSLVWCRLWVGCYRLCCLHIHPGTQALCLQAAPGRPTCTRAAARYPCCAGEGGRAPAVFGVRLPSLPPPPPSVFGVLSSFQLPTAAKKPGPGLRGGAAAVYSSTGKAPRFQCNFITKLVGLSHGAVLLILAVAVVRFAASAATAIEVRSTPATAD